VRSNSNGFNFFFQENAALKMCQIEMEDRYLSTAEENLIFQSTYAEATQTKSSEVHGHGYLAKHWTRKVLLQENVQLLARNEAEANSKENAFREEVARAESTTCK
jgi:hypothetical protein